MATPSQSPIYRRIKQYVLHNIDSGKWPTNHQIPPESELVKQFKVSRMTVNRAMSELASEGRISRHPGRGSFVADQRPRSELLVIRSIAEEIRERGHLHSATVHGLSTDPADEGLAKAFGVAPGSPLFHSVIVHCEDGLPIQLEDRYVNPELMPHYIDADFTSQTPNEVLAAVSPVRKAEHLIEAVTPDAQTCRLLGIRRSEPCLLVYRVAYIDAGVSSVAWLTYPGSRYRLSSMFRGSDGSVFSG